MRPNVGEGQEATTIRELSRQVSELGRKVERVETKIDGQTETLTQLKVGVGGFPGLGPGVTGRVDTLEREHDDLREEFDEHVETQGKGQAERQGRWLGARMVWVVFGAMISMLGAIILLILNIDRLIGGAGGP